ncbi:MAG: hypothetical protein RLZZ135_1393, partial [Cyanobacteriota bacterium]
LITIMYILSVSLLHHIVERNNQLSE